MLYPMPATFSSTCSYTVFALDYLSDMGIWLESEIVMIACPIRKDYVQEYV